MSRLGKSAAVEAGSEDLGRGMVADVLGLAPFCSGFVFLPSRGGLSAKKHDSG